MTSPVVSSARDVSWRETIRWPLLLIVIPVLSVARQGLELGAVDYLKRNRSACGSSWRASAPFCGAAKLAAPRCNAMLSVAGASLAAGNWTGACGA
jgi:hypothetical protein